MATACPFLHARTWTRDMIMFRLDKLTQKAEERFGTVAGARRIGRKPGDVPLHLLISLADEKEGIRQARCWKNAACSRRPLWPRRAPAGQSSQDFRRAARYLPFAAAQSGARARSTKPAISRMSFVSTEHLLLSSQPEQRSDPAASFSTAPAPRTTLCCARWYRFAARSA